jgi:hypothetical protein
MCTQSCRFVKIFVRERAPGQPSDALPAPKLHVISFRDLRKYLIFIEAAITNFRIKRCTLHGTVQGLNNVEHPSTYIHRWPAEYEKSWIRQSPSEPGNIQKSRVKSHWRPNSSARVRLQYADQQRCQHVLYISTKQGCRFGSGLDPDLVTLWIRICIGNPDPGARKLRNFSGKNAFFSLPLKRYKKY